MRLASLIVPFACGILGLFLASDATAQGGGERRSGWYVGGGFGVDSTSELEQTGFNRDPLCYPTDACFDEHPRPEFPGYRWIYDLDSAAGAMFELSADTFCSGRASSCRSDSAGTTSTRYSAASPPSTAWRSRIGVAARSRRIPRRRSTT